MDPDLGKTALAALRTPQPPSINSLLVDLINDISDRSKHHAAKGLLLVLDDFHLITESKIHESLIFFLDHLPLQVHLILSSRSDPPWPLARVSEPAAKWLKSALMICVFHIRKRQLS